MRAALDDAAAISLLSLIPPDRVGCIRKLRLGHTLKRREGGGWDMFNDARVHRWDYFVIAALFYTVASFQREVEEFDRFSEEYVAWGERARRESAGDAQREGAA